jgi:hypothetical protein
MRRAQHIDLVSEKPLVGEMRACKYECRLELHRPKELIWVDAGRLIISTDRTTATAPIACACDLTFDMSDGGVRRHWSADAVQNRSI